MRKLLGRPHDPRIDKLRRDVRDLWIFRVTRHHDGNTMLAGEGNERLVAKTLMSHFERMPDFAAIDLMRQKIKEGFEVVRIELFGRSELPIDRAELVLQFEHAAGEETFDGF